MQKFMLAILLLAPLTASAANVITYPERAEKLHIEGVVNVIYDINAKGHTENIRVVSVEPKYVFDRGVKKQIAQWQYPEGQPQKDVPLKVIFKAN